MKKIFTDIFNHLCSDKFYVARVSIVVHGYTLVYLSLRYLSLQSWLIGLIWSWTYWHLADYPFSDDEYCYKYIATRDLYILEGDLSFWSMVDELLKRSISWYRCRSFPLFDCTLPYRFISQKVPIATRSYHFVSFACILEHTACSSCTLKVNTIAFCLRRSNCVKLRNHRFAPRFSAFSLTPGILWRRHT